MGLTSSITHYYTYLLPSKVNIRKALAGHSTSVLVPCSCLGFRPSIPQKIGTAAPYLSAHVYYGHTITHLSDCWAFVMVDLRSRCGHYILQLWLVSFFLWPPYGIGRPLYFRPVVSFSYFFPRLLAALLDGTRPAAVTQTLWRGTKNRITELWQRAPPIFGWAAIMLGIGPHSTFSISCTEYRVSRPLRACLTLNDARWRYFRFCRNRK